MTRRLVLLCALIAALGASAFALQVWRNSHDLSTAIQAQSRKRFRAARDVFQRLCKADPTFARGEAAYRLGECELALGRDDAAERAWARVPADGPWGGAASLARARLALRRHRFATAEPLLLRALALSGAANLEARHTLAHIYKVQGRLDEVAALHEQGITSAPDPLATLKELWRLRGEAYPAIEFVPTIDAASRAAPEDDRVLLARANLATRMGRLAEADTLLLRCEAARPTDPAVQRSRLLWSAHANRTDVATSLLTGGLADELAPDVCVRAYAWLLHGQGDPAQESVALQALVAAGRASGADYERLAELALESGHNTDAKHWRARKADYDRALPRYHELLFSPHPTEHADDLASLAQQLGWPFEAAYWKAVCSKSATESSVPHSADDAALTAFARECRSTLASHAPHLRSWTSRQRQADDSPLLVPALIDESSPRGVTFQFDNGRSSRKQLPETMAGGVALLDYNSDGWLDIYFVQGGHFPPRNTQACADRLYRNRGNGTFEDVSSLCGVSKLPGGYGFGVAAGDINRDGLVDLFVTRWRAYALYLGVAGGRFVDATTEWKLDGDRGWPTSAALADFDNDGDLDLYVCHYARWDELNPMICRDSSGTKIVYCPPVTQTGEADHLLRNDGSHFTDVTIEAGIDDGATRGLGVVAADFDADGLLDLFVANDMNRNVAFHNLGGLKFVEVAESVGLSSNAEGGYLAGMGVGLGDFDNDERPDLAVTNFYGECTRLYRNLGMGQFSDHTTAAGLAGSTRYLLGFGISMLDINNDGYQDLFTANGHVDDMRPAVPFTMPAQLLLGNGRRFRDVGARGGPGVSVERLGRGLAAGDLDNDGRQDVVLIDQEGPAALLMNHPADDSQTGTFLTLTLVGTRSNRDGIGARVTVSAGGRRRIAWRFGGGSYLSSGDPRLHFGLGNATEATVDIHWPSGALSHFEQVRANMRYQAVEGKETLEVIPGQLHGGD